MFGKHILRYYAYGAVSTCLVSNIHDYNRQQKKQRFMKPHVNTYMTKTNKQVSGTKQHIPSHLRRKKMESPRRVGSLKKEQRQEESDRMEEEV